MSEILYGLAGTVPLWRVPVIVILFMVIVVAFELMYSAIDDD